MCQTNWPEIAGFDAAEPPDASARSRVRGRLDRVRHVDELVLDAEPLGDRLPEPADAERLGRIVACSEEVEPGLAGVAEDVLGRLPRQEGVEAEARGLVEDARPGAGDDADPLDPLGPAVEDQRLAAEPRGDPCAELLRCRAFRTGGEQADR